MIKKTNENGESYCEFDGNCKPEHVGEQLSNGNESAEVDRPEAGNDLPDWVAEAKGAIDTKEKVGSKPGKDYCSWDKQC